MILWNTGLLCWWTWCDVSKSDAGWGVIRWGGRASHPTYLFAIYKATFSLPIYFFYKGQWCIKLKVTEQLYNWHVDGHIKKLGITNDP